MEVIPSDGGAPKVDLSLRESRLNKTSPPVAACPDLTSALQLKEGQVVQGYITNISAKGCFVAVGRGVTARVKISELADKYLENLPALFPPGKLVEGRVLTIDRVSERVEMSLKHSVVRPSAGLLSFADISPGMHLKGTVKKVQSFGVFVNIADSNLSVSFNPNPNPRIPRTRSVVPALMRLDGRVPLVLVARTLTLTPCACRAWRTCQSSATSMSRTRSSCLRRVTRSRPTCCEPTPATSTSR